jgi:hypothetical protein
MLSSPSTGLRPHIGGIAERDYERVLTTEQVLFLEVLTEMDAQFKSRAFELHDMPQLAVDTATRYGAALIDRLGMPPEKANEISCEFLSSVFTHLNRAGLLN